MCECAVQSACALEKVRMCATIGFIGLIGLRSLIHNTYTVLFINNCTKNFRCFFPRTSAKMGVGWPILALVGLGIAGE